MKYRFDATDLPAFASYALGYTPSPGDVTVVFLSPIGQVGLTANINKAMFPDASTWESTAARELISNVHNATKALVIGWGPDSGSASRIAAELKGRIPGFTVLDVLHTHNNQVRRVTSDGIHDWMDVKPIHPEIALLRGVPHATREELRQAFSPLSEPTWSTQAAKADALDPFKPSLKAQVASRYLTNLATSARDTSTERAILAHLVATSIAARDTILIEAVDDRRKSDVLVNLYRTAPRELRADLAIIAAFTHTVHGGSVEAAIILSHATTQTNGNNDGLKNLLTTALSGAIPDPVEALRVTVRKAAHEMPTKLDLADAEWETARSNRADQPDSDRLQAIINAGTPPTRTSKTSSPTHVEVDGTVVAQTRHVDLTQQPTTQPRKPTTQSPSNRPTRRA